MSQVIDFPGLTENDVSKESVLKGAEQHVAQGLVVLGYDKDGRYFFASQEADARNVVWLLQMYQHQLLSELSRG